MRWVSFPGVEYRTVRRLSPILSIFGTDPHDKTHNPKPYLLSVYDGGVNSSIVVSRVEKTIEYKDTL